MQSESKAGQKKREKINGHSNITNQTNNSNLKLDAVLGAIRVTVY